MTATQVATTQPKPQMLAGGQVAALVPQSLEEAFRVSQAIAASGLAPKGMDKTETIMVAIMAGAELGLAPFQALQSFAVVNGRPTLWGDGLMAVARAQGIQARETLEGSGDQMVATCSVTRPDTGEIIERSFSVPDAIKAGLWNKAGPWQQYPRRMLQMRARAWALRDGCADMLRGFQVREEVEDYQPMTARQVPAERPNLAARLAAPEPGPREGFNTVHGEQAQDPRDPEISDDPASPSEPSETPASETRETSDAGDDFPGDKALPAAGEGEAADPSEADVADEEKGSAVDLVKWADKLIEDLPAFTADQFAHFSQDRAQLGRFAILKVQNLAKAQELEAAIDTMRGASK